MARKTWTIAVCPACKGSHRYPLAEVEFSTDSRNRVRVRYTCGETGTTRSVLVRAEDKAAAVEIMTGSKPAKAAKAAPKKAAKAAPKKADERVTLTRRKAEFKSARAAWDDLVQHYDVSSDQVSSRPHTDKSWRWTFKAGVKPKRRTKPAPEPKRSTPPKKATTAAKPKATTPPKPKAKTPAKPKEAPVPDTKLKGARSLKVEFPVNQVTELDATRAWDICRGIFDRLAELATADGRDQDAAYYVRRAAAMEAEAKGDTNKADSIEYSFGKAIADYMGPVGVRMGVSGADWLKLVPIDILRVVPEGSPGPTESNTIVEQIEEGANTLIPGVAAFGGVDLDGDGAAEQFDLFGEGNQIGNANAFNPSVSTQRGGFGGDSSWGQFFGDGARSLAEGAGQFVRENPQLVAEIVFGD